VYKRTKEPCVRARGGGGRSLVTRIGIFEGISPLKGPFLERLHE